jgi:GAF domain-containing protein/HAMP domain-containing protein
MSISNPKSMNGTLAQHGEWKDRNRPDRIGFTPHSLRLRTKLAAWFVLLTILASVVLTFALFINVRDYLRRSNQQRLIDLVSVAALQVNPDTNASLKDPQQESSTGYLQIKQILQHIRNSNQNIRYIYTVRYINHQAMFIVDAETDPQLVSHLGDIYQEALPSALLRMSTATKPYVEPEINSDQWGTWITSCAPLFLSNGERGDFLCMDMSAGDMYNQERRFLWIALAILAGMLPFVVGIGWFLGERLATPLAELIAGTQRLSEGDLQYRVNVSSRDETAFLAETFNSMADRLNDMVNTLGKQVEERTREIERRSNYLTAAAEVGRVANSILDPDLLGQQVIELIQKQFDLYYVGLFITSEDGKWAVLRAGTGEIGKILLSRQHQIEIGEGMIGWCISNGQSRVAHEVSQDAIRLVTPELSDTRSEAALPLCTRGRIIGALTVQSERIKAFDETAMVALQTMADQFAVALDNARLFTESRAELSTAQKAFGDINQTDWAKIFHSQTNYGYYGDRENINPLGDRGFELSQLVSQQILHLPIRIRGQIIGTIHARKPEAAGVWNPGETALLETLVDQLSIALDNARLYRDTQRSAEREHTISNITAKVRASTNVNAILQTAVRELAEALRVSKATILLHNNSEQDGKNTESSPHLRSNGGDTHV